jgi:signal transduction histidine kinase/CheY-like chemotaxis protein
MLKTKDNLEITLKKKVYSSLSDQLSIARKDNIDLTDELIITNRENRYLVEELIIAKQEKSNRANELNIAKQEKVNRADELVIANEEKNHRADELAIANEEKNNRANELIIANEQKVDRADELIIANEEKSERADELVIANKELAFQNKEKDRRADELVIANRELAFQNKEKDRRASELVIANEEKNDRADELIIANEEKSERADELIIAKKELAFQNKEKDRRASELVVANEEKNDRADELVIANRELAFQNKEKDRRADELVIANRELAFQNIEKDKRASELVIANKEKNNRANELAVANKELAFQNKEKDKRANELIIANNEKVFLLQKLQLSQKMEALGKLTGGISHEYNNMLGIISGYCELIKQTVTDNTKLTKYANEIQHAGNRAAKLTSKLLAFSQERSANAEAVDINMLLKRQHDMLQKTLTISINLIYSLHEDLWQVWLDGSDMEDAVINLCINAMHAMNEHGKLTIETKNKNINQDEAVELNITPGEYVLLSFTDTGCGFDEKIKEKIFDPFFTTKGEFGTGLGLSIVYSFVQNSGGGVDVHSVEGEGTQFKFYFPRHNEGLIDVDSKKHGLNKIGFKEKEKEKENILLVDDEPLLLEVTSKILSLNGYNVFCAQDATGALSILKRESIHILISDVVMPNIDGYELATIIKEKYPDIKIQLVSGYSGSRKTDLIDFQLQKNMLHKPVDSEILLSRIRKLAE